MPRPIGTNKAIKALPITAKRFSRGTKAKKLVKNPQYRGGGAWVNPLHYVDTYAYYHKGQRLRQKFQLRRRDALKVAIICNTFTPKK